MLSASKDATIGPPASGASVVGLFAAIWRFFLRSAIRFRVSSAPRRRFSVASRSASALRSRSRRASSLISSALSADVPPSERRTRSRYSSAELSSAGRCSSSGLLFAKVPPFGSQEGSPNLIKSYVSALSRRIVPPERKSYRASYLRSRPRSAAPITVEK